MLKIFGTHDAATVTQLQTCLDAGGEKAVLCADGHKGYSQPVGGVVGYKGKVSISGVGYDIACGNMACRTDAKLADVRQGIFAELATGAKQDREAGDVGDNHDRASEGGDVPLGSEMSDCARANDARGKTSLVAGTFCASASACGN